MHESIDIFDDRLHRIKKEKAKATFSQALFLAQEIEQVLLQRFNQLQRTFQSTLVLGCPRGLLPQEIASKVTHVHMADRQALPFQDHAFDLVIDGFELHWINHVPQALLEVRRVLRPGGNYLAGFLGERTLNELRQVLIKTDLELHQGAYGRVSPFLKLQTMSNLMTLIGFKNPVIDHDLLEVHYKSIYALITDLRNMGETNCLRGTSPPYRRHYFEQANRIYHELFATSQGSIPATFDCLYIIGEN